MSLLSFNKVSLLPQIIITG